MYEVQISFNTDIAIFFTSSTANFTMYVNLTFNIYKGKNKESISAEPR